MRRSMTVGRIAVVAAMMASLAAPGAAADAPQELCVIRYTPSEDFRRIVVVADLELNENEWTNLTTTVDADGDGHITRSEVAAYENASHRVEEDVEDLGAKKLYVDGYPPWETEISTFLTRFEGPTEARDDRLVQEFRVHKFRTFDSDWYHFVQGGLYSEDQPRVAVEFVVLESPPGWVVWSVNGTEFNRTTVSLPAFDTQTQFEVVYAVEGRVPPNELDRSVDPAWVEPVPSNPTPSPGVATWLSVVATIVVVSTWRRRTS